MGYVSKTLHARIIEIDFTQPLVILNSDDAMELGIKPGNIVLLTHGERYSSSIVMISKTMVSRGDCLITGSVANKLGISKEGIIGIRPLGIPPSFNALKKRIQGERLNEGEYVQLIKDMVNGLYGEAEIASFLVSQLYKELTDEELGYLIKAMVEAGSRIKFEETAYDTHSVGGVPGNSKVALITVPIVASYGLLIPKTSSRAITSPAGTADTMEVLARVDLSIEEIVEIVRKVKGVLVWGGHLNLAPADDLFVSIERRLAIDPEQQMVASILSKKLAMGIEKLVIDIPTGRGAKVKDIYMAERLASIFMREAGLLGIAIRVAITYGGQPIGMSIGPALEAREALKALIERKGSKSLVDKAILLAGLTLEMCGKIPQGMGENIAREIFLSGKAYEKFREIVEAQSGDPNVKPEDIPIGKYTYTITSQIEGAVTHIDNAVISTIAKACGAPYDKGAGIQLHVKVGYRVNKGDPILTLYSNSESRLENAISLLSMYQPVVIEGMLLKIVP
ncbi:MAG: AMP phosphorylase [Desulfurococcaceae archaeon]